MVAVRRRSGLKGSNLDADSSNNLYTRSEQSDTYVWDPIGLQWVKETQPDASASTVVDNRQAVTTAGTRVQFSSLACKSAAITAELANTGVIVVGSSTVVASAGTRRGIPLSAGDTAILSVTNMNLLWMDSTVNGEGVTFVALS